MSDDAKEKRRQTYLEKYGGEEGYRAEMRRRSAKSRRNPDGRGGFSSLTPEQRKEIGRKAANKRWQKH